MRRNPVFMLMALVLPFALAVPAPAQQLETPSDWRETYAYTLGVQAYVFGFPYV